MKVTVIRNVTHPDWGGEPWVRLDCQVHGTEGYQHTIHLYVRPGSTLAKVIAGDTIDITADC